MKQNSKYYNMLLCFGIYSCGGLSVLVGPIIYNLSQIYPDVPMTTIRLATSIPSLVSFICGLFIAPALGKRLPYKATMLFGCLMSIIGGILPAFWNATFTQILIGRALYGLGFSVFSCRNAIAVKEFGTEEAAK